MPYSSVITNGWNNYANSNFNIAVSGTNFDISGDQSIAPSSDLIKDSAGNALYSRFDNTTGTKYLLLRAAVDPNFGQKLIINFDINTGSGFDSKIDFALVADASKVGANGVSVADGIYVTGSTSGSLNTQPNNTDFTLGSSNASSMLIPDSAIAATTVSGNSYIDIIINFDDLYALLQNAPTVVPTPYPTFSESTPLRFAITSSTNLNNVNKDISGTSDNDLSLPWSTYLSSTASLANLVAGAPGITNIPENAGGGINAAEATDGTTVVVDITGTNAAAGNTLTINWGSQTVNYTLTATDITNNNATVTIPSAAITAQGNGTFNVTARINSGTNSSPVSVTVDTTAPTAPAITSIPEASGGLNIADATNGTIVEVDITGTGAVAGDTLSILWGGQTVNYTLTSPNISSGSATVTIPQATIATQGDGTFPVIARLMDQVGNVNDSAPQSVSVDVTAPGNPTITSIPEAAGRLNASEASDGTIVNVSLTGTGAVAGDTLRISWGGRSINTVLTASDISNGNIAVTVPALDITTFGSGGFSVLARLFDSSGNANAEPGSLGVLVDLSVPSAPTISVPEATGGINAAEASNGTTVNVDLTGTGAASGDTLTVNWGGQTVTYTLTGADISGNSAAVPISQATIAAQGNGTFNVTASITDPAGNTSPTSTAVSVTVDTIAPTAPGITSIVENSGGGINATEASDGTPVAINITGTGAAAGDTLTLNWGTQTVTHVLTSGDITANAVTLTVPAATIAAQGNGTTSVTAKLTDQVGNVGADSAASSVNVDTTVPTTVSATVNGSTLTINHSEALNGSFTPVSSSYIVEVNGNAVAVTAIAINNSSVVLTLANPVLQGNTVMVDYAQPGSNAAQDLAGNAVNSFTDLAVTNSTGDTTPPTVSSISPSTVVLSDADVGTGTFDFTIVYSEAMNTSVNPTISFPTAGENPSSTLTFASGSWTNGTTYVATYNVADANTTLPTIDVRVTGASDGAGNVQTVSNAANLFSIDTTNPTVVLSSSAPSVVNGLVTVVATFSRPVGGFTSSDLIVTNGTIASAPTTTDGVTYSFSVNPTANGALTVNLPANAVQDEIGNQNAAAANAFTRTVQLTAPTSPTLDPNSDTGTSNADNLTNNNTPTIAGTATPGGTVELFVDTVPVGTATADSNGRWSFSPSTALPDGTYAITTRVTPLGGSAGAMSAPLAMTVDTAVPTAAFDVSNAPTDENQQGIIVIRFNEPVRNLDVSDLMLTRGGTPITLANAVLSTTDNKTWTLSNVSGLTGSEGAYQLAFSSSSDVSDLAGNRLTTAALGTWGEVCELGSPTAAINFQTGKLGVQQRGTNSRNRIRGGRRNDQFWGLRGRDVINGRGGNDRINGGASNDRLNGGAGNDELMGQRGNDRLNGGGKRDQLDGGASNDRLNGGGGEDILIGGLGQDVLTGGQGRDMFVFKSLAEGIDRITDFNVNTDLLDLRAIFALPEFAGGTAHSLHKQLIQQVQVGSNTEIRIDKDGINPGTEFTTLAILENVTASTLDCKNLVLTAPCVLGKPTARIRFKSGKKGLRVRGQSIDDRQVGSTGNDWLKGGSGNDTEQGNDGKDQLFGDGGKDRLLGGKDRDRLNGGADNDRLLGQEGDDILIGGTGTDILTGGSGKDMFVFQSLTAEGDRITDFDAKTDLLDLRAIFARPEFAGAKSHAIHEQLIQAVQVGSSTQIQIDADGIGAGTTKVTLVTLQNVVAQSINCSNYVL